MIGPVTEARIVGAFSSAAIITADAAAEIIGLDVKVLREMTAAGIIASVPRGRLRAYTEGNIRAYLEGSHAECLPKKEKKPRVTTVQVGRVVPFSQRKGARRHDSLQAGR